MPTGWTSPISPFGASYGASFPAFLASYAISLLPVGPSWLPYENGEPVPPDAPTNVSLPTITGAASVGITLQGSNGTWSSEGLVTYAYQWKRNGVAITGATNDSYTLQAVDVGTVITLTVTATNLGGSTEATSLPTSSVTEDAPVNTVLPVISGIVRVGETLNATTGSWTSISDPSYAFQWKRNGTNIDGATSQSYELVQDDYLSEITITVTATNGGGSTPATSNPTAAVGERLPINTVLPVVTGSLQVIDTLTSSTGTWTSTTTPSYSYQWKRNGNLIDGATISTYQLQNADYNALISCEVTATNTSGGTPATSSEVGPVTEIEPNDISDCVLWLRPDLGVTKDGSNKVSDWANQGSVASSFSQGSSGRQPTYEASAGPNGTPVITFNNSSLGAGTTQYLNQGNPYHIVVVYKRDAAGTNYEAIFGLEDNTGAAGSTSPAFLYRTPSSRWELLFQSAMGWSPFLFSHSPGTTDFIKYELTYTGSTPGSLSSYGAEINDVAQVLSASSNGAFSGSVLGNWNNTTSTSTTAAYGKFAEIIVYQKTVSGTELQKLNAYLSRRYGL